EPTPCDPRPCRRRGGRAAAARDRHRPDRAAGDARLGAHPLGHRAHGDDADERDARQADQPAGAGAVREPEGEAVRHLRNRRADRAGPGDDRCGEPAAGAARCRAPGGADEPAVAHGPRLRPRLCAEPAAQPPRGPAGAAGLSRQQQPQRRRAAHRGAGAHVDPAAHHHAGRAQHDAPAEL
ncbi:MAG: hypothetical protein AVDCRST_MAG27-2645, partial [uncultured Craurococcus sp.]